MVAAWIILLIMGAPPLRAQPPTRAVIIFGADTVTAEVAATPMARERGLMFREAVPEGSGMLFVFPDQAVRGFWMRNTLVDLDIAMLDRDFVVVDLHRRTAGDRQVRDGRAPFLYALEVPAGWFDARGIGIGSVARIEMPPPVGGR